PEGGQTFPRPDHEPVPPVRTTPVLDDFTSIPPMSLCRPATARACGRTPKWPGRPGLGEVTRATGVRHRAPGVADVRNHGRAVSPPRWRSAEPPRTGAEAAG